MAYTQWTDCTNNNLTLEQIFKKHLIVVDYDGTPSIKVTTANDVILSSMSDARIISLTKTITTVKAAPGNILGWNIINPNATTMYLKFYDRLITAFNPAVHTPVLVLQIPANGSIYQEANCVQQNLLIGIAVRTTLNLIDTDDTNGVTPLQVNIKYN